MKRTERTSTRGRERRPTADVEDKGVWRRKREKEKGYWAEEGRASERGTERERENKKGLRRERGHGLGQDPGAGDECSVEIDRGHGVTMVVLHGTPFIRYNAG